jgi:hypothetical protein
MIRIEREDLVVACRILRDKDNNAGDFACDADRVRLLEIGRKYLPHVRGIQLNRVIEDLVKHNAMLVVADLLE